MKKRNKNIVRETVRELECQLHGIADYGSGEEGFTPMEAQMVYNILETFVEKIQGLSLKCDNCGLTMNQLHE
jgi:hypothetical protein